jgi:hypothetical protein
MNEIAQNLAFGAFFVSTVFFLRRAGYSWFAAVLVGLGSPIVFIVLYAIVGFPLNMLAGALHIPERILPSDVVSLIADIVVVAGWCVGGYFLRRDKPPEKPKPSDC